MRGMVGRPCPADLSDFLEEKTHRRFRVDDGQNIFILAY